MPTANELLNELLESMKNPLDEEVQNVTQLIYGDSGGGKTVLALQMAQAIRNLYGGEILFIDAVNAWRSLKNHHDLQQGVKRVPYKGKTQLELISQALEFRPAGFENITVVILDELSSMTDKDGDVVLKGRALKDTSKDPDVLTQPDMGATIERMRRVIIDLLKIPTISIICVAHERNDEDKGLGFKVTRPRFYPKFSGTLREHLDVVAHMSAKPTNVGGELTYKRQLQVHPTTTTVAKSRVGGMPVYVSPEVFVAQTIKWLKGEEGDSTETTVLDSSTPNVSEDSDFSNFVVE